MIRQNWKFTIFVVCVFLLILVEALKVYLLNPIGNSQEIGNTAELSHFLAMNIGYFRVIIGIPAVWSLLSSFSNSKLSKKIIFTIFSLLYIAVFCIANFYLKAEKHFLDINTMVFESATKNKIPLDEMIIGIEIDGEAKAYSVDQLAYHHKINDKIANQPVLVTYCSMCRSARVFDPTIDGIHETFRLVGATEYNAMMEDNTSQTWWQQATGEAVAGEKKGAIMKEIPFKQTVLESWICEYPNTKILQADTSFTETYCSYEGFAKGYGMVNGKAEEPWEQASWIIGVSQDTAALAFDYTSLTQHHLMHDSIGDLPIIAVLEKDTISFHVWEAQIDSIQLSFEYDMQTGFIIDQQTLSVWDMTGKCIKGKMEGKKLLELQSYVEYWHSWQSFHPNTKKSIIINPL